MDQCGSQLRRRGGQAAGGGAIAPEIAFLEGRHVDRETLKRASRLAREWGTGADMVLTHCGWISQDSYYRALAAHAGIGFTSLHEPVWEESEEDILARAQPGAEVLAVKGHDGARRLILAPRGAALRSLLASSHGGDGGAGLREKIRH